MKKIYLLLLIILFSISGCSYFGGDDKKLEENWPVDRLYSEAKASLNVNDYTNAIKYYEQLEARFPFGKYAQQALLESAYAKYKLDEPEEALATIDRFIRVYPLNPNIDYAYYLRGLVNFNRDVGLIEKYVPRDESQRDPGSARRALDDFSTVVSRFPKSIYAKDSAQRIVYLRNRLAEHEVEVATYYMRRGAYVAALNRGRYVIENYPRTPATPDALIIMAKAYKILELDELSDDVLRVIKTNYPGNLGAAKVNQVKIIPDN